MRTIGEVTETEVMDHWKRVEKHTSEDFRWDIREALPDNLQWFLCEVEHQDVEKMFIISSGDWTEITGETFKLSEVARRYETATGNEDTIRLRDDMIGKVNYMENGGQLDECFISLTDSPSLSGPFTLIEGNRRSTVLARQGRLVGKKQYVGYSPDVATCKWTENTYKL